MFTGHNSVAQLIESTNNPKTFDQEIDIINLADNRCAKIACLSQSSYLRFVLQLFLEYRCEGLVILSGLVSGSDLEIMVE